MGNATSPCAMCGVEFVPEARRRGRPDSRFCTAACRALWERTHGTRIVPGPSTAKPAGTAGTTGPVETTEPVETAGPVGTAGADAGRPAPLPPLGTEHSCPHCGHQLTIVNFVLPSLDSAGDVDAADDGDVRGRCSTG
ncbi:hypothetical protein [Streptomyces glaucus]|uniref:Uncharacterized protein n=1 Tax=Streptomyces glaucus TaxID=284029 RepID=A0ABN3KI35_9ACTN